MQCGKRLRQSFFSCVYWSRRKRSKQPSTHTRTANLLKQLHGRMRRLSPVNISSLRSARHVGIAFEHENFQSIHSFQRLYRSDDSTETKKSILFYIMQIPEEMRELRYRLVINGLWSTDPLNPDEIFDRLCIFWKKWCRADMNYISRCRTVFGITHTLKTESRYPIRRTANTCIWPTAEPLRLFPLNK